MRQHGRMVVVLVLLVLASLLVKYTAVTVVDSAAHATMSPDDAPKNVILLISDGMGYNHVDAASLYEHGATGSQVYETFPYQYGMSTYETGDSYDPDLAWSDFAYVKTGATDSAAAATAMSTGFKTYSGAVGVDTNRTPLTHIFQYAEDMGKMTGVVSSVEFSHATPAAFVAHNTSRGNYGAIAQEMIYDSATDVIMGAGHPLYNNNGNLVSADTYNYAYVGSEDTWNDLLAGTAGGDADGDGMADAWSFIDAHADFQALIDTTTPPTRVFGVPRVRQTLQQRRSSDGSYGTPAGKEDPYVVPFNDNVPTLEEMTRAALNVLDEDPDGLYLMVEAGAVDWAGHSNQKGRMIEEQSDFNRTVEAVVEWVETSSSWDETLVMVTSDHETGYLTAPGAPDTADASTPLVNNGAGNVPGIKWNSSGHTNSLVPFYAKGQGAALFEHYADETDPVRGPYIDNIELARAVLHLIGAPFTTEDPAYVVPVADGVMVQPILTVGEAVPHTGDPQSSYRMVGALAGLGTYQDKTGTVRLFMSHTMSSTQVSMPLAASQPVSMTGSIVSEYMLTAGEPVGVISGSLALDQVYHWETSTIHRVMLPYIVLGTADIRQAQSANIPTSTSPTFIGSFVDRTAEWQDSTSSAYKFASLGAGYLAGPHHGFDDHLYLTGENTSAADSFDGLGGLAVAFSDAAAWTLPGMGHFAKAHVLVVPDTGSRTLVLLLEGGSGSLDSQLYMYVGEKAPAAATAVERAGLVGGELYFFRSTAEGKQGEATFTSADGTIDGEWINVADVLEAGEQVWNLPAVVLDERVQAAGAFNVTRVGDAAYDPNNPMTVYFSTTGSSYSDPETGTMPNSLGRINRLDLGFAASEPVAAITPTLTVLLEGDAGDPLVNPNSLAVNVAGTMMIQETPDIEHQGTYLDEHGDSSIWMYDLHDSSLTRVAEIDRSSMPAATRGISGTWQSSGIIDVSNIYGADTWLLNVQAHTVNSEQASLLQGYSADQQLVHGGQLLLLRTSDP
jgi:alkaline phosphatase